MIDVKQVGKVYSGINGKCCCGCSGKYWYASDYQTQGGAERGYPVEDEDVSDVQVKRITNLINKHPELRDCEGDGFISIVKGNRLYISYFRS